MNIKSFFAFVFFIMSTMCFSQAGDVGDPFPDFTLTDLDGESHTLSDHLGEVVLIFLLYPT